MRSVPVLALTLALGAAGTAAAQPEPTPRQRAIKLNEESAALYQAGRFREAADILRVAYRLHPSPTIVYNLGRALEGLGDVAGAVQAYEQYLATAGTVPDRAAIEARLRALRDRLARLTPPASGPSPPTSGPGPPPPRPRGPLRRLAPYGVAGLGVVTLGVGAVVAGVAWERYQTAKDDPGQVSAAATHARARDLARTANILFAVGGGVAVAGAVWLLLDRPWREAARDRAVTLLVGPGGLALAGAF